MKTLVTACVVDGHCAANHLANAILYSETMR